jgi:hypothetical protein
MIKKGNILIADKGKLIMHINKLCASKEIALGKEANPLDWIEIDETQWDFENDKYKE